LDDCDAMLICDRLDVLVEGSVGSNRPCVAECFLWWPFRSLSPPVVDGAKLDTLLAVVGVGTSSRPPTRAAGLDLLAPSVGREKFVRLDVLELGCAVNCA
jgi:hypothetical protein